VTFSGWWFHHQRDWSRSDRDEAMRRHVNKNYE
jgi:hypothetical protein